MIFNCSNYNLFKDFFSKLNVLTGGIDDEIREALNISRFRSFASIKSIPDSKSFCEAIAAKIKIVKLGSVEAKLVEALVDNGDFPGYEMDLATTSSLRTILDCVKDTTAFDFNSLHLNTKKAQKRPTQNCDINEVKMKIRKRCEKLQVQIIQDLCISELRENSFFLTCPIKNCVYQSTVFNDTSNRTIRMVAMEKHFKEIHSTASKSSTSNVSPKARPDPQPSTSKSPIHVIAMESVDTRTHIGYTRDDDYVFEDREHQYWITKPVNLIQFSLVVCPRVLNF